MEMQVPTLTSTTVFKCRLIFQVLKGELITGFCNPQCKSTVLCQVLLSSDCFALSTFVLSVQTCGCFGNTDQSPPSLVSVWAWLGQFQLPFYRRKSLHLCNLQIVRVVNGRPAILCTVPPLPGRYCVATAYLKKRRGASWSDRRLRGLPRRRPLRSGSSHAMLMARGELTFWEVEFGGDGRARDWGALFTAVKAGGGFPALLQKGGGRRGINSQINKNKQTKERNSVRKPMARFLQCAQAWQERLASVVIPAEALGVAGQWQRQQKLKRPLVLVEALTVAARQSFRNDRYSCIGSRSLRSGIFRDRSS